MTGLTVRHAHRVLIRPKFGNPWHIEALRTLRLADTLRRTRALAPFNVRLQYQVLPIPNMSAEQIEAELKEWRASGYRLEEAA